MKGKKVLRVILLFFAIVLWVCNVYLAGYSKGAGYAQPPGWMIYVNFLSSFLMGVFVILFGVLTEKYDRHIKIRKAAWWIGGFFTFGAIAALMIVAFFR